MPRYDYLLGMCDYCFNGFLLFDLLDRYGEFNLMLVLFRFLQQDVTHLCLSKSWVADARVHYRYTEHREQQVENIFASVLFFFFNEDL